MAISTNQISTSFLILLMEEIRRLHQLRMVVYPIINWVSYIQGGAGFLASTVLHRSQMCFFLVSVVFLDPKTAWTFGILWNVGCQKSVVEFLETLSPANSKWRAIKKTELNDEHDIIWIFEDDHMMIISSKGQSFKMQILYLQYKFAKKNNLGWLI